jgi:alkanesulfonate monooxygenase SsuD/methylene tetrahydromethanopterin reductase-like flavin-dependent oxidoreductase (luciferase family)
MKIGLMTAVTDSPDTSFDDIIEDAQKAEAEGFSAIWMANIFGLDAISTLSIIGRATKTSNWAQPSRQPILDTQPL